MKNDPINDIFRGIEVEHIITGIKGIATSKSTMLNGSVQFLVERKGTNKDGEAFKHEYYDIGYLKNIGIGMYKDVPEPAETDINLGDKVEHFSEFQGIVIERVDYLNGCVSFFVVPKAESKSKSPVGQWISAQYLTLVKPGIVEHKGDKTQGPSSSAPHDSRTQM